MAGGHAKVHVRCPYYRTDNGSQRIVCEGVLADSLYFADSKREEATRRGVDVSADDFQEIEDDGDLPF